MIGGGVLFIASHGGGVLCIPSHITPRIAFDVEWGMVAPMNLMGAGLCFAALFPRPEEEVPLLY